MQGHTVCACFIRTCDYVKLTKYFINYCSEYKKRILTIYELGYAEHTKHLGVVFLQVYGLSTTNSQ